MTSPSFFFFFKAFWFWIHCTTIAFSFLLESILFVQCYFLTTNKLLLLIYLSWSFSKLLMNVYLKALLSIVRLSSSSVLSALHSCIFDMKIWNLPSSIACTMIRGRLIENQFSGFFIKMTFLPTTYTLQCHIHHKSGDKVFVIFSWILFHWTVSPLEIKDSPISH